MKALNLTDGYKVGHAPMFPEGTSLVFNNLTSRSSRIPGVDYNIFFGLRYYIKRYLIKEWNDTFFSVPKAEAVAAYKKRIDAYLGPDKVSMKHIEQLHDLGYLPIRIMALPEGSKVPTKVPFLVTYNTHPSAYWLPNYLETLMSVTLWPMITSATTAFRYRQILESAAEASGGDKSFVKFQGHDFSMRGMFGVEAAIMSGAAHLTSFLGTDTFSALDFCDEYYGGADGYSVPATEHAVMCMGGEDDEIGTFKRLITEVHQDGIVSIVSDTWDFWKVVTEYLPALRETIMARNGKVVIRPDSGDPVDILCGTGANPAAKYVVGEPWVSKGLIECLWDIFGGTINEKGFKVLDPHIGAIYGDSITPERAQMICDRLFAKGFSSTNVVFGIGSYTYQYVTRDTYGMAIKATYGVVNDKPREIFKKPKTDNGGKNSAKGLLAVHYEDGRFLLQEQASWADVNNCAFDQVFLDGLCTYGNTMAEIRSTIDSHFQ